MTRDVDPKLIASVQDLRVQLGLSKTTTVVCRSGGKGTFDLPFVQDAVVKLANNYTSDQLVFLFLNTDKFVGADHPNIRFLPTIIDNEERKESFLKTCDALLHGRSSGETFGWCCPIAMFT